MSARILLLVAAVFCATAPIHVQAAPRQNARDTEAVEPNAGNWKTWVIPSGKDYLVPPPPGAAATRAELRAMADIMSGHDAQVQQQIEFWNAGAPSYRWVDNINARVFAGLPATPFAHRVYTYVTLAMYSATVATWYSKVPLQPAASERDRRRRLRPVAGAREPVLPIGRRRDGAGGGCGARILLPRPGADCTKQWPNRPGGHGCRPAFSTRVIT